MEADVNRCKASILLVAAISKQNQLVRLHNRLIAGRDGLHALRLSQPLQETEHFRRW